MADTRRRFALRCCRMAFLGTKVFRRFSCKWLVLGTLGFFATQAESTDGFPAVTSSANLPGYPALMRANATGHRAIVMLARSDRNAPTQAGLVVDIGAPTGPILRGQISVQGSVEQLAVSPDGSTAILLASNFPSRPGENKYTIISLSLSNPAVPVETGRYPVPVKSTLYASRGIALAPDASGYAFIPDRDLSQNSSGTVVLRKMAHPETDFAVETRSFVFSLNYSQDGRYLALGFNVMDVGAGGIIDLATSPPSVQLQEYSGLNSRYQCMLGVLKGGYVLVSDGRVPRLGFYGPSKGMPRLATLPSEGGDACPLTAEADASVLVAMPTRLLRLDIQDIRHPRIVESWLAPVGFRPLAMVGSTLFEAGADNALHAFRLNLPATTDFDWIGLAALYEKTMSEYRSSRSPARAAIAFAALSQAGAAQATDLPVKGISIKSAAAILNDYGFFGSAGDFDHGAAEAALRRAIDLDPARAPAYLNLADLLQSRLAADIDFEHRRKANLEIATLYQSFLSKGGHRTEKLDRQFALISNRDEVGPVCQAIADYANEGYLSRLITDSALGVELRGRRSDLFFTTEGTSHVPSVNAFDSDADKPVNLELHAPWLDDLWGGDALGLVVYHGTPFLIHYKDTTHPVHVNSLNDDTSCEFVSTADERISLSAQEPELCRDLIAGKGPSSIELGETAKIPREKILERYGETVADARDRIDIENNGVPVNVVHLALASGAGAGCDEEFFDVLNETGDGWGSAKSHELVSELQHLTTNRYPILPCGNSARLFQYRGHVFFEGTWPPLDTWHEKHHVARIENGRAQDVCGITFRDRIDVLKKPASEDAHEQATQPAERSATTPAKPVFGVEYTTNTYVIGPLDAGGVSVASVESGSIAEVAGIEVGDLILRYNGVPIHSITEIRSLVRRADQGQAVMITLWRQNAEKTVEAHF